MQFVCLFECQAVLQTLQLFAVFLEKCVSLLHNSDRIFK